MEAYFERLRSVYPLSAEGLDLLKSYMAKKHLSKGDFILRKDETCRHIYFVNKGFARIFYFKNGKEITEWFTPEKNFCFSITSYFEEKPSHLIIECLEDSEVIYLSKEGLDTLCKTHIEISNFFSKLISGALILSQKRMDSIQFETARQRYEKLLKTQPYILQKAPMQYLASFLGITPETLSRIRTQI
ncbi:MAG: Crp/Fnr family transcriptional regulator [Bacteroidetes bacterium]|nr:Crp/Fnr family transcriptional regulator [Bacteroidota bacterium]